MNAPVRPRLLRPDKPSMAKVKETVARLTGNAQCHNCGRMVGTSQKDGKLVFAFHDWRPPLRAVCKGSMMEVVAR